MAGPFSGLLQFLHKWISDSGQTNDLFQSLESRLMNLVADIMALVVVCYNTIIYYLMANVNRFITAANIVEYLGNHLNRILCRSYA